MAEVVGSWPRRYREGWAAFLRSHPEEQWTRLDKVEKRAGEARKEEARRAEKLAVQQDWLTWQRARTCWRDEFKATPDDLAAYSSDRCEDTTAPKSITALVAKGAKSAAKRKGADVDSFAIRMRQVIDDLLKLDEDVFDPTTKSVEDFIGLRCTDEWKRIRDEAPPGIIFVHTGADDEGDASDQRTDPLEALAVARWHPDDIKDDGSPADDAAEVPVYSSGIDENIEWDKAPRVAAEMIDAFLADEAVSDWLLACGFVLAQEVAAYNAKNASTRDVDGSGPMADPKYDEASAILGIAELDTLRERLAAIESRLVMGGRLWDESAQPTEGARRGVNEYARHVGEAYVGRWLSAGQARVLTRQLRHMESQSSSEMPWLVLTNKAYGCDYKFQFAARNLNGYFVWRTSRTALKAMALLWDIALRDILRAAAQGTVGPRRRGMDNAFLVRLIKQGADAIQGASRRPSWHPLGPWSASEVSPGEWPLGVDERKYKTKEIGDVGSLLALERAIWTVANRAAETARLLAKTRLRCGGELLSQATAAQVHKRLRSVWGRRVYSVYLNETRVCTWLVWDGKKSVERIKGFVQVAASFEDDEERLRELAFYALDRRLGAAGLEFLLSSLVDYEDKCRERDER